MPRRLVVSCDGTWNTATDDTNVARLHARLATTDDQLPRYFPGVGTDGGPVRRVLDGAFGTDLGEHVREVYRWLAETFRPGDELVLLGFSRGAFTVRSTVGMLAQCGLVAFTPDQDDAARTAVVARVFTEGYRAKRRPVRRRARLPPRLRPRRHGARRVPRRVGHGRRAGRSRARSGCSRASPAGPSVAFHDLELAPDVRHARQALAPTSGAGPTCPRCGRRRRPGGTRRSPRSGSPAGTVTSAAASPRPGCPTGRCAGWSTSSTPRSPRAGATTCRRSRRAGRARASTTASTGVWRVLSPRPRAGPRIVEGAPDVQRVRGRAPGTASSIPPYRRGRVLEPGESGRGRGRGGRAVGGDRALRRAGPLRARGLRALARPPRRLAGHRGASPWPVTSWPRTRWGRRSTGCAG